MAYTQTLWNTNDPITQERMRKIEQGIEDAHNLASTALNTADGAVSVNNTQNLSISNLTTSIGNLSSALGGNFNASHTVDDKIEAVSTELSGLITLADLASAEGGRAWRLLLGIGVEYDPVGDTYSKNLALVMTEYAKYAELVAAYQTPSSTDKIIVNNEEKIISSLAQRILHIYNLINTTNTTLEATSRLANNLSDALGLTSGLTIAARLTALDGGNIMTNNDLPSRTIKSIIDELAEAHNSAAYAPAGASSIPYNNLDERLEVSELEIKNARGINASIKARLDAIDNNLNPTTNLIDLAADVNNAHGTYNTLVDRLNAIDDINTNGTIVKRVGVIESELNAANTGLKARMNAVESTLNTADTGLIARMGEAESRTDTLETLVANIANELNMTNIAGQIQDTTSRIDTIEENVVAIGKEIGMLQDVASVVDLSTSVSRTNTRVDELDTRLTAIDNNTNGRMKLAEDDIDALETALGDSSSGLTGRISTIETTINNGTTGLAATKAIADEALTKANAAAVATTVQDAIDELDSRLDAIDGGTTLSGTVLSNRVSTIESDLNTETTGLKAKVTALENKDTTYTEVISDATFDTNGKPQINNPSENIDYLIKGANSDTKYYYWKYIKISSNPNVFSWEKISGDGSGSGNSNAEDYATKAAFEAARKELNKDYYVLESDGIRHHYRYLSTDANAQSIEIGIPTSQVKVYQVDNYYEVDNNGERTDYLDFYGFNFGTNVATYNIDPDTDASYRLARIELPKGGSGNADTTGYRIYAKVRGDDTRRISLADANNGITLNYGYTCYSYSEEDGYAYRSVAYTLTRGDGTVIASSHGLIVGHLTKDQYTNGDINITIPNINTWCTTNQTTEFTLTLHSPTDETIRDKSLTVYITVVDLALRSEFSDQQTYSTSNNLIIPYTFTGMNEEPTFIVLLDNNPITTVIAGGNITIRSQQLSGLSGVHSLSIKASLVVSGTTLYSNTLNYQLGLTDGIGTEVMLFSGASLEEKTTLQYLILKLPYYLYVPSTLNDGVAAVSFEAKRVTSSWQDTNPVEIVDELYHPTENLTTGSYNYNFRLHEIVADIEYYIITISCSDKQLVFKVKVNRAEEQINIKTENLVFDFKPERYNNNTSTIEERLWSYAGDGVTYKMRIPDGAHFDWRTGGWIKTGEDEVPCFCVKAGSRVEFILEDNSTHAISPLTLFWNNMELMGGSNFKCTFKIDNVKTPNAPFLTSLDTETNTIINYGKTILSSKQDIEDDDTLLYNYLNVKYIHTETFNGTKSIKEAIGTTVFGNEPFSAQLTQELRAVAETSAASKNIKKIKQYISNMYDIANQASNQDHRAYLLRVLAGKADNAELDYGTIKDEITTYLQVLANAQAVYNRLVSEGTDNSTTTYAYRQAEPVNFDAMLNGFVVEGKAGKDGIIAMIQFTFVSEIRTGGIFSQTISAEPISTNSFAKTGTFLATVTDTRNNTVKTYEVEMLDEAGNGTYTEIVSIRDASNVETRAYGLELNALGSNIYLPSGVVSYAHSEGDVIEFEYNVNPEIQGRVNSSIIIYEDGVPSAAKLYTSRNNIFEQTAPGCLTIGSDDCDVYIYKMRLYDQALNNADILANFYADGLTTDDMMDRYNRNKNLVKAQTITPQLIAEECPDLRIIMIEAPNLTGGKTSFIKNTKVRCIYKNGRPEDNWVALNAYHAGQGTSSDNYGVAGRNLDIMFGFDGQDTVIVPKPQKNNYTFDPTYKSMLIKGLNEDETNDILTAEEYESAGYTVEYNGTGKVSLSPTSVPNNWFNIKVNIASSENTNNAFLQKRFDRYLKEIYKTPAQERDSKIKNDMEFFNCVVFIKETGTPSEFTDDKDLAIEDRPWHFYGIGNLGDSKKTDSTRVNVEGDPYEFCIEISDNGLKNSGFCSGVFYISNESKNRSETNADLTIINDAVDTHVCVNGEYTVNGTGYTFSLGTPSATTLYLVPVVTDAFTYYRRFMYDALTWKEIGEPITFTRTSYGIKYPVSAAEWTCSLNDYRKSLYDLTSGKGWDKSFEFRYDITTKDGETVARNDIEAAMNSFHQLANKKAFADMYSWIVTASNTDFHDHLDNWFIEKSPLYWYLFTERYTMIDSRAKNTFYHYGKVYISTDEYNGTVKSALEAAQSDAHAYAIAHGIEDDTDNNVDKDTIAAQEIQFKLTAATFIYNNRDTFIKDDTQAAINDGYRFDLWDYDNDTALGINNNGQMVFNAGLEDIDKDVSGWIYNEAESVIWRRIRENMYDKLGALYVQLKGACFNAENLILEFDNMQNQFPEELWRLDFERKYYRPFISKGETTYLNDMANGRKRYQRRQFERNMAIYINSKYQRNGSYNENDIISFRPQFTWSAGRDTTIIIKPYSTMYINFALGNYDNTGDVTLDTTLSTRINRGETYMINAADYIHDFNNIQCIIYNASRIMELDGLGNFECKLFILGAAKKLSVLKLGSAEYPNRSMQDINNMGLSDGLPLLEELDLTNIQFGMAPDTFALDNFPLLKKLNATGCNIRSFTFKDGGMLEQIIFPDVLTKIEFKNLYNLVDTVDENENTVSAVTLTGAANLISYNSENSYSNSYLIVQNMLNNAGINRITQLKLNDIDWTIGNISELQPLVELHEKLSTNMSLAGVIHITGTWSTVEVNEYHSRWPGVTFDPLAGSIQLIKHEVIYKHNAYDLDDGTHVPETILKILYIPDDTDAPDIYYTGEIELPTQPSSVRYNYTFGLYDGGDYIPYSGWVNADYPTTPLNGAPRVRDTLILQTWFDTTTRTYPIKWYLYEGDNDTERKLVKTSDPVEYEAGANQEAPTVKDIHAKGYSTATVDVKSNGTATYSIFKGWHELPNKIHPSANDNSFNIYADWETNTVSLSEMFNSSNLSNLTPEQLLVLSGMNESLKETYDIFNKLISGSTTVEYTLGQDSIKEGIELLSTPYRADRNRLTMGDGYVTDVQPFNSTNDAFTIAIDYNFNPEFEYNNSANVGVLASCYERDVSANTASGFILYYNLNSSGGTLGPRIAFGNIFRNDSETQAQSVALGSTNTAQFRNMLVLRHPAGSNTLYIYSGIDYDANQGKDMLATEIKVYNKTWSNLASNAYLRFGCLIDKNSLTSDSNYSGLLNIVDYGGGTVYWAKYWNEDLGVGECKRLASWPHEKMTYLLTHLNNDRTTNQRANATSVAPIPSVFLTSLTASIHGLIALTGTNSTSTLSWADSIARDLANERVFLGLPIKLLSILCKSEINNKLMVKNSSTNTYGFNSNPVITRDYIYLPSGSNIANSDRSTAPGYAYQSEESEVFRPFTYLNTTNIEVYRYDSSNLTWVSYTPTNYYEYLNLRFSTKPIKYSNYNDDITDKLRIFIDLNNEILTSISAAITTLRPGDIFIDGNNLAYMYILNTDRQNLGIRVSSISRLQDNNGGWTPAYPYWLRSVAEGTTATRCGFLSISTNGYINSLNNDGSVRAMNGIVNANLSYSMAI